jgi:hypothetical protein
MRIFSKILPIALVVALLVSAAFATEGIYDRDLVRGFLSLKGDFRSMKSNGVRFINEVTGKSYPKNYLDGHVEIGAEYLQLRTWFDIDFMPITPERGSTEWYSYGVTWMWGYKLLSHNSRFNIIPSIGPGFELQNIRKSYRERVISSFGPALNLELEFRLQFSQFSAGLYGGYKIVRHDSWDNLSAGEAGEWRYGGDVNADKIFAGLKFSWTMLNNFQKREKDLL